MIKSLLVGFIALLGASAVLADTKYPAALDDNTNLPPKAGGDIISSSETNTQNDAIKAIEEAIGTDSTLQTGNTILDRLDDKADTTDLEVLNPRVLMQTLNATEHDGGDIGAQVNDAQAGCNAVVGSGNPCRIIIPPGTYSQVTAISLTRSRTELDCQGSILLTDASFADASIRVNYTTPGSEAGTALEGITLRNCVINASGQTSMQTLIGASPPPPTDTRYGAVVIWKVNQLFVDNIKILEPFGPGLEVYRSQGAVSNIFVTETELPYAEGKAAGVYLEGEGYGAGAVGTPIIATNISVDTSESYGIHAVVGVILRNPLVRTTDSACLALGGAEIQGWISATGFDLQDCALAAVAATGAIDDLPAFEFDEDPLKFVAISSGTIRRAVSDGVLIGRIQYEDIAIVDTTVECWGSGFTNSRGIVLHNATRGIVRGNTLSNSADCVAQMSGGRGLEVVGLAAEIAVEGNVISDTTHGVYVTNFTGAVSDVSVIGNTFRAITNSPVVFNFTAASNVGLTVQSNLIADICTDASSCGVVLIETSGAGNLGDLFITGNTGSLASARGLETDLEGQTDVTRVIYSNNAFWSAANEDRNLVETGVAASAGRIVFGTILTDDLMLGPPSFGYMLVDTGSSNISAGDLVCVTQNTGAVELCQDSHPADSIAGVAAGSGGDDDIIPVIVAGYVREVACGSNTIAVGDALLREDNGRAQAGSPGAGEQLGKALTTCSGGDVTVAVGLR